MNSQPKNKQWVWLEGYDLYINLNTVSEIDLGSKLIHAPCQVYPSLKSEAIKQIKQYLKVR